MDVRSWAFLGSRLLAVSLLVSGVYGVTTAFAAYQAFQLFGETPRFITLYAWTPATAVFAAVFNLAVCYVLWVHASWIAGLLTEKNPPAAKQQDWSGPVFRALGVYVMLQNLPSLVYYAHLSQIQDNDAFHRVQLITYILVVAVGLGLAISAGGFKRFIEAAGPGPSEPDER